MLLQRGILFAFLGTVRTFGHHILYNVNQKRS